MDQCPHCGSPITDGSKCPNCGQSLDALPEYQSETTGYGAVSPDQTNSPPRPKEPPESEQPEPEGTPKGDSADTAEATDGPLGGRLSRRALLGAGAGSVAVVATAGVGWQYLQGGGEGNGVVRSYVDGISANDWSGMGNLYHDDAPVMNRIEDDSDFDSYEGFLESQETLSTLEELEPTIDSIGEFYHITEITRESVEQLPVEMSPERAASVDELRSVVAFITVGADQFGSTEEDQSEYYDDGMRNQPLTCQVVLADGRWQLWSVQGLFRFN